MCCVIGSHAFELLWKILLQKEACVVYPCGCALFYYAYEIRMFQFFISPCLTGLEVEA